MVKVIVGMMGSSVAKGSASLASPAQVREFLACVKSHKFVKELDTALVYNGGVSEKLLGEVQASKDFAIATKAPGFSPGSLTESNILANCATSLKSLQQDQVDIYYIHGPDRQTPLEEQCRAFGQLYKEGKFKRFGVSNLRDAEVQQVYDICSKEGYCLPSVYQGGYSPLHRKSEKTLLPLLKKLNMSYYAFSPFAGGLLAKRVDEILKPAKDGRYDAMPVFGDLFLNETILNALKKHTELCDKNGVPLMEATMRWFMHHSPLGEDDGFILGASTTQQIDKSLTACEKGPLPEQLVTGFETLWTEIEHAAPGYSN